LPIVLHCELYNHHGISDASKAARVAQRTGLIRAALLPARRSREPAPFQPTGRRTPAVARIFTAEKHRPMVAHGQGRLRLQRFDKRRADAIFWEEHHSSNRSVVICSLLFVWLKPQRSHRITASYRPGYVDLPDRYRPEPDRYCIQRYLCLYCSHPGCPA
jgi:hypothetical protein